MACGCRRWSSTNSPSLPGSIFAAALFSASKVALAAKLPLNQAMIEPVEV